MINFLNNPFDIVLKAVKNLYDNIDVDIVVTQDLKDEKGETAYGCTVFPDDGKPPIIFINKDISVEAFPEILSHEIAHVISGINEEHNEKWDKIFSDIQKEVNEKLMPGIIKEFKEKGLVKEEK